MIREFKSHGWRLPVLSCLTAVLALGLVAGCGDDDDDNTPPPAGGGATSTAFTGWLANGVENGSLAITVNAPNLAGRVGAPTAPRLEVTSTGTLSLSGSAPIDLTGTLDDETGDLTLAGGGYTLTGIYIPGPPGNMFGSYTGPNGDGSFDVLTGGSSSATVMCGEWTSDDLESGTFTFTIRGSEIEGVIYAPGSPPPLDSFTFTGTVSGTGTSLPVVIAASLPGVGTLTANGTLDTTTNTVTDGTWDFTDTSGGGTNDGTGTWTSGLCD